MSQCLRCSKPCEEASVFCDTCQSLLRSQLWDAVNTRPEASMVVSPVVLGLPESDKPLRRITGPNPVVNVLPQTPPPPSRSSTKGTDAKNGDIVGVVDQAIHRLNEAARRIAEVEQGGRRMPRASRLSPMRDISADIERQSTPLPKVSKETEEEQGEDLGKRIPDLWPWLQEDADESENDNWSSQTDPLMARQFPKSAETKRIEEEDLRRALAEGLVTVPVSPVPFPTTRRRMRIAFFVFAILAIIILVVDSVLLSVVFVHPHHSVSLLNGPPSLTFSTNEVSVGQTVVLHIRHFSSDNQVYLTHDIQETVQLTAGTPLVKVGPNGSADVTMLVDSTWGPGFHTVEAEGVTTRYTASATLQIIGAGPTRPAHLLLGSSSLDLGADYQGANTIQLLTLHNAGSGAISWTASSNQPWLLLSPTQGMFSASQTVTVAVERANLKVGDYKGIITFSSNVGSAEAVQIRMTVRPLPANIGAVLVVTPPVLSFSALDGGSNPGEQALMVSNPGSQPLHWSLVGDNPIDLAAQSFMLHALGNSTGWLSTDHTSGVVLPHGTSLIHVVVDSRNLLAGVYTSVLAFSGGQGVFNSPQNVSVSLTVGSNCGLALSSGIMSFTAVAGQNNPSNRSLSLSATASCAGVINWKAISAVNWLTVTPASGQLKNSAAGVTAIGVNATILKPGNYVSNISFIAAQSTQTLTVQLVVQALRSPSAPIMGATPLSLNFSTTQGMANPPGQVVTITNTGRSQLNWHTTVNTLATSWLGAGPTGGTIPAGQTGQVTITINTANLTPNTYIGQIVLIGTDTKGVTASGSPQTITVNLLVLPPCTLQKPSLVAVAFSATEGSSDPGPQTIALTASGNCGWPLSWHAALANPPAWLKLSSAAGSLVASGQSTSITVAASIAGLTANTYTAQVAVTASDGSNTAVQGSSQIIAVTLNVLPPCSLQVETSNLTFSVAQGQSAPPAQSFSLSESGNCARPVSWSAVGDAGSNGWLVVSQPSSGTDSGIVHVGIDSQNLGPGTYTGTLSVAATGSGGAPVEGSPQQVSVTLIVTGYTLSGTIIACSDASCSSTRALPGASLSLVNNSTNQPVDIAADGSGNYSFSNLALGSYTLTVTGSDGTTNYSGTATLNITGDQSNFSVNTFPR